MWKTTLIFLIAVLLTVLLSLTLSGCAWSCQPGIVLADSMSVKRAMIFPVGMDDCIERIGVNCRMRF